MEGAGQRKTSDIWLKHFGAGAIGGGGGGGAGMLLLGLFWAGGAGDESAL